ncbi:MAG: ADP-ribosylglycohydrolase family protein [Thermoproteota archaeon]
MLKSKFVGCMMGSAIGDALGSSFEGFSPGDLDLKDAKFEGRWTDDTHMMIGVAESLVKNGGFDARHMLSTFIENWETNPWRGYGPGPPKVFRMVKSGIPWKEAPKRLYGGMGSFGNGAAMRVAPVGLLYYNQTENLRQIAQKSAEITHTHELGIEGAALQAYAIALAIKTKTGNINPQDFLGKLISFSRNGTYIEKLERAKTLLNKEDKESVLRELGNGVEAFNSVPTAIFCFAKNLQSYAQTVLYALRLGGDTDTIAAMSGAIAGAYHGTEDLRKNWRSNLEKNDYITNLALKLYILKEKKGLSLRTMS